MAVFKPKEMIGKSPAFLSVIEKIPQIAQSNSSVLIIGETGTGKEIIAGRIHFMGPRRKYPFVPVNCGAIPPELAENELFGHEGGAFTGATALKLGLIRQSEGGTLFLDEIDSFSPAVQVKLLRFLEDKTYRPLGDTKEKRANVRVIAALNADPDELIKSGKLRQDLYYRLNIFNLRLPTLKERREDIMRLAFHFLSRSSIAINLKTRTFSNSATQKLLSYGWPGNVRELEHVIERATIFCDSDTIEEEHIVLDQFTIEQTAQLFQELKSRLVSQFERDYIEKLLLASRGNITQAAIAAKMDRRAFMRLIRKYHIDVIRFTNKSLI